MAQQHQAVKLDEAEKIAYTPVSDVAAGAVVVQGSVVGFASQPIPANTLCSLHVSGGFRVVKANGAITAGAAVYWDADGNPQGGEAGSGAITTTAAGNTFVGYASAAAGATDETVDVVIQRTPGIVESSLANVIADPGDAGAIPVTVSGHCALVTEDAETRTLAAPTFPGQQLLLYLKTDGGDCVVTCATTINETGNDTITFDNEGESILLTAVEDGSDLRWRIATADGAGLSTA